MAKLNKEQLKKLYDYGGTLSPKDWANLIDNMPENPIYNKKSLPIVKTTYEEVRELYNSGKMDPNIKYQFDYKYYNTFDDRRAYFKDLIIYLDGGTVKAEYTGVAMPSGDHITTDGVDVYDKSFKADFIFDSILTSMDFYECKRPEYLIDLNIETEISFNDYEKAIQSLKDNGIPHEVIIDDYYLIYIKFYNVLVYGNEDGIFTTTIIYDNYRIVLNDGDYKFEVTPLELTNIADMMILAAIVNVQYDNDTFHKIFVDTYGLNIDTDNYFTRIDALDRINFYNGNLDTYVQYRDITGNSFGTAISFTDINSFLSLIEIMEMNEQDYSNYLMIEKNHMTVAIEYLNMEYEI